MRKFRIVDVEHAINSPRKSLVLEDGRVIPMSFAWSLATHVKPGDTYFEGIVERRA